MFWSLCLALAWACAAQAATVSVGTGQSLQAAVTAAQAGDILELAAGLHTLTSPLLVTKPLTIRGPKVVGEAAPLATISVGGTANYSIMSSSMDVRVVDVFITAAGATPCKLREAYALEYEFGVTIETAYIRDNLVVLEGNMGPWYNTRGVIDANFGNCSLAANSEALQGFYYILDDKCQGRAGFKVRFNKLLNCGVVVAKTASFVNYRGNIEFTMTELIEMATANRTTLVPSNRTSKALARLNIQLDRVGQVTSSLTVNYLGAELEAVITNVNSSLNSNTTNITVNLLSPSPFTIGNSAGRITFDSNETEISTTNWTTFGPNLCNNLQQGDYCNRTISFRISGCDITGSYVLADVPISCQASSLADGTCPAAGAGSTATVRIFLDGNNFCAVNEFNISALFQPEIVLRTDNLYNTNRGNASFWLGDWSFWSIRIWTNDTGVRISDAVIVGTERTSDGNCTQLPSYISYMADPATFNYTKMLARTPPELVFPLFVNAPMACASAGERMNNVNFTYTIQVDYVDARRRRRRNSDSKVNWRREAAGVVQKTSDPVGIGYRREGDVTDGLVEAMGIAPGQMSGKGGYPTVVVAIVGGLSLLLCCCGFVMMGYGFRVSRRAREKTVMHTARISNQTILGPSMGSGFVQSSSDLGFRKEGSMPGVV